MALNTINIELFVICAINIRLLPGKDGGRNRAVQSRCWQSFSYISVFAVFITVGNSVFSVFALNSAANRWRFITINAIAVLSSAHYALL